MSDQEKAMSPDEEANAEAQFLAEPVSPSSTISGTDPLLNAITGVCTENLILVDYVTESPNVNGDDRAALFPPDPVRLAVQVEEPT